MTRFYSALLFVLVVASFSVNAQQNLVYNHYFLNPYLYNPSYIAPSGYTELYMNYRKQWAQFDGAPTTATLNLQLPINYKMGFGVNLYNDQAGVLQTNSAMMSFAYQVYLGKSTTDLHKLGFGMSAGVTMNNINLSKVDDPSDPSLTDNNTSSVDGQFGINYQYNNLKIGFALPRLFVSRIVSENGFNTPQLDQLNSTISTISYNFTLSPRLAFEPYFLYRTSEGVEGQFEGAGVLKIDNLLWAGGSYRQNYGPAGFLGFNLKDKLKVGYAYEFAPEQTTGLGNGSHEVQVILRIGKKKRERPVAANEEPIEQPNTQPQVQENKNEKPEPKPEEKAEVKPVTEQPIVEQPIVEQKEEKVAEKPVVETKTEAPKAEADKEKITTISGRGLRPGHYVVVGVFRSNQNALNHMNNLKKEGYSNATVSYSETKQYYYVHMGNLPSLEDAASIRDQYRKETKVNLRDSWVLHVE
jgi:type IX secretion system PorP/SprF family membrane protein